jgi:thioredoxin-like negative regulator of GroEL
MRSRPTVVLYARPDCHLCDEVRAQLEALRAEGLAFELEEVNIDSDDRLLARYLERIPVVVLDGQIVSELGLDSGELRARLDTVSA